MLLTLLLLKRGVMLKGMTLEPASVGLKPGSGTYQLCDPGKFLR